MDFGARCEAFCLNTDLNIEGCDNRTVKLPTGLRAEPREICNDVCDVHRCEDEAVCNGYTYGMFCETDKSWFRFRYIPPYAVCDGTNACKNGEDEAGCTPTNSTGTHCRHGWTRRRVPVHNYTRCMSVEDSKILLSQTLYCMREDIVMYQTNCTDRSRIGVTCDINGYWLSVSKYLICLYDDITACDDHIDSTCYSTRSCKIHKHLLCDGKQDCDDNSDETHLIYSSMTKANCN